MTARDNVGLVQRAYTAVGKGEISRLVQMMSDDITIQVPGPTAIPFAGTYRGHAGVEQFFRTLAESAEVRYLEPTHFIAEHNQVAVLGHEQLIARPTGRTWTTDWAMVWTIEEGEITALQEFHQTAAIATAFANDSS